MKLKWGYIADLMGYIAIIPKNQWILQEHTHIYIYTVYIYICGIHHQLYTTLIFMNGVEHYQLYGSMDGCRQE